MNRLQLLMKECPRFFSANGTIHPKTDRKTREVLAQLLLGEDFTLDRYATAFSIVTCKKCNYQFASRKLHETECARVKEYDYPPSKDKKHNNVFYLWKVAGLDTYKIGVTSHYLKDTRIQDVARRQGVTPQTILYIPHYAALEIEILAKQLFKPNRTKVFMSGDGYSEFYDFKDIKKVLRQIDDIIETIPDPT